MRRFRNALVDEIETCIGIADPFDAGDESLEDGAFLSEAEMITDDLLDGNRYFLEDIRSAVSKHLEKGDNGRIKKGKINEIAEDILDVFDNCKYCMCFYEDSELCSRIEEGNIYVPLKINEHFIVESFVYQDSASIYVNDSEFVSCKKNKAVQIYKELLNDYDTVYIQYKPKLDSYGIKTSKIKTVKKSKFNYDKLRKKEKIEKIFDRMGLIN